MLAKPEQPQVAPMLSAGCTCAPPANDSAPWECYCGLGPNCSLWRQMTPEGRASCSRDKRMDAEYRWKNGLWAF